MTSGSPDGTVSVEYDAERDAYTATFDAVAVFPSVAVVETIATVRGEDPGEFTPLYEAVSPRGLDDVCRSDGPGDRSDCVVEFSYLDYDVTVSSRGRIDVEPLPTD